jgi:hypothetical protein
MRRESLTYEKEHSFVKKYNKKDYTKKFNVETLLIFDSDCGICLWLSKIADKILQNCLVEPYQKFTESELAAMNLTKNQCLTALQLVHMPLQNLAGKFTDTKMPSGEVIVNKNGFMAISHVLEFNGKNKIVNISGKILSISFINYIGEVCYKIIAKNRHRIKLPRYNKCQVTH